MKQGAFLLILIFLFFNKLIAQHVIITPARQSLKIFAGIDNPLNIIAEKYACKDLKVEVSNGSIKKSSDCNFVYHPDTSRVVTFRISVSEKGESKLLTEIGYSIWPLPNPEAAVGGYFNLSSIPVAAFRAQGGVSIAGSNQYGYTRENSYTVTRYDLSIIHADSVVFHGKYQGNAFTPAIREALLKLEPGMTVLISSIYAVGYEKKEMQLQPLEYNMK